MDLKAYIDLSIKVLTDWRVIACAAAILVIWTLFRFVGIISHRSPRRYAPPKSPPPAPASRHEDRSDEL